MVKFYRTKDGEIVSLRGGRYYDGRNFFRFNPKHLGNQDFLAEEIKQPPDDLAQEHLAKWKLVPQEQSGQKPCGTKPSHGAS